MKRKRIVVMGFMGSMPIAGVIWQHIHYIVGLQRLGHTVYYIEDSARYPYDPEIFEFTSNFDYAAKILRRLGREFDFHNRWAFCARYLDHASTSGKKDITWRGERYLWSKSREFIRFVSAPKKAGEPFELATEITSKTLRNRFLRNDWLLRSPREMSADYDLYRSYIQGSKGEFTVAKDQYVRLNTGWFSDRSACYLAAGRPVITQETGFSRYYGQKEGLLSFRTLGEIT